MIRTPRSSRRESIHAGPRSARAVAPGSLVADPDDAALRHRIPAAALALLLLSSILPATQLPAELPCGEIQLLASDGEDGDHFGTVALGPDVAAIGASSDDHAKGSVYLFGEAGGAWIEQDKLAASDGAPDDNFGSSISLSGGRIVVGAWLDDDLGSQSGSVYVYEPDAQSPTGFGEVKLHASDGGPDQWFGMSVATSGNRIAVGAQGDDDGGYAAGAAYVFRLEAGAWVQEAKLLSADLQAFDIFGASVAITSRRVAVGALGAQSGGVRTGAVYVFRQRSGGWVEEAKLVAGDPDELDFLGTSVAITRDGRRVVAGAAGDDGSAPEAGAAYVFRRDGTTWSQEAKLSGVDTRAFDLFGTSVAIIGRQCAVGAPYNQSQGAAYVFRLGAAGWSQLARIEASDETVIDEFGASVAQSGQTLLVGAPLHAHEFGPGAAYVYDTSLCGP